MTGVAVNGFTECLWFVIVNLIQEIQMTLRVDGKEISQEAIDYELQRLVQFYSPYMPPKQIEKQMDILREKAKQQAIGTALLLRDARSKHIAIPDSEVEQAFVRLVSSTGGEQAFESMLTRQGLTADEVRSSILTGKQVDRLVAQVTADIPEPTDEEIREYYEAHSDDYKNPERSSAQHILIKPKSDTEQDKQEAKHRLSEIRKEFEDGSDFSDLAAKHSDCASGQKTAGQLGWISRDTMVPEFEEVLFSTPIGEVSQIVETSLGYHIILPSDYEEARPASFEDARETVRALLSHSLKGKAILEYTEKLKAGIMIEDDPS